jgi:hypothetical protein
MAHELETGMRNQMLNVAFSASEKIIEAHNLVAGIDQSLAQMRAEKTGSTRDQDRFSFEHKCQPI